MEDGEANRRRRAPRYPAEDTSPTTERELKGFYCYGLAAEVFAVCGVGTYTKRHLGCILLELTWRLGSFLPVTLEQLARERGVLFTDRSTSCMAKNVTEVANSTVNALLARADKPDTHQCVVTIFGAELNTVSLPPFKC